MQRSLVAGATTLHLPFGGEITHPPICIWEDIAPKREKIVEKCIFFFAKQQICDTHIAKYRLTSIECPRREEEGSEGE